MQIKRFDYVQGLPEMKPLESDEGGGKRHYILPNGSKVPSVTTVLGHFKRQSINEWRNRVGAAEAQRISNTASTRGTRFHNLLERYVSNKHDRVADLLAEQTLVARQAFYDVLPTVNRIDNIHYIETPLYSEKMLMAGRTDVIGEFDGTLSIIDFKTALREKKEEYVQDYFQQATAYALMYEERIGQPIDQIVIIISADGLTEPQLFVRKKETYIQPLFDKILEYHREHR
jgi:PD-(D/E)XK nuclease superfamily